MVKIFRFFVALLLIVFLSVVSFQFPVVSNAEDEIDRIGRQIEELEKAKQMSEEATVPLEAELGRLEGKLDNTQTLIDKAGENLIRLAASIVQREKEFDKQYNILADNVAIYYKQMRAPSAFYFLISSTSASSMIKDITYQASIADEGKKTIAGITRQLLDLERDRKKVESDKVRLADLQVKLDQQAEFFRREVTGAKKYQEALKKEIAGLTAKQQDLIARKLASLNIPRSAGTSLRGCVDDRGVDPGFSPRFAFFTYGAPHRNGLNQYGAWGRAKAGQNEEQILQEYYPNMTLKKDYDQSVQIVTTTGWSGSIEDYVKRIYEVPDFWTDNNLAVLKAQAVAARSYALNSMQRNGSICTTESCQVFKPDPKGGNWDAAVEVTKGWVLMDGNNPGFTQYASTHGGYILNLGKFDGRDGNPNTFSELNERAYDKDSPWFYCDWGSRSQYSNTAWIRPSELADIVNVILLTRKDSSTGDHLYQTDKPHPYGGEVWSEEKVKQELGAEAYSNISDVSISVDFGSGKTTTVNVSGDGKSDSFNSQEFKDFFNLRAPANIQIVGPLYNVERK